MFVSFFACSICREHNVILLLIQSYNVNSIALISFCNDFLFVSFFSRNILFIHGKSEWAHARERSTHTWIFKTIWWCSFRLLPFAYFSSVLYNSRFFCEYFFSLSLPSSPCVCMLLIQHSFMNIQSVLRPFCLCAPEKGGRSHPMKSVDLFLFPEDELKNSNSQ